MHPDKRCLHGGSGYRKKADAIASCDPTVPGWAWNSGKALLPFAFDLAVGLRPRDGSAVLRWIDAARPLPNHRVLAPSLTPCA